MPITPVEPLRVARDFARRVEKLMGDVAPGESDRRELALARALAAGLVDSLSRLVDVRRQDLLTSATPRGRIDFADGTRSEADSAE
jgi:hypothetical protein